MTTDDFQATAKDLLRRIKTTKNQAPSDANAFLTALQRAVAAADAQSSVILYAIDLNLFKRRDLPNILTKFQIGGKFLSRYFSRQAIQASSDRSLRSIKATNAVI